MPTAYPRILFAVDLLPDTQKLVQKARQIIKAQNVIVHFVHVIEQNPITDHMYVDQQEFQQQTTREALQKLTDFVGPLLNENNPPIIEMGIPKKVIVETAEKLDCNLILVGSHGKSGVRALLGSTSNAILHHTQRDVLVIHY